MDTTANVKKITVVGVMTALNIVIARVFLIPVPMTKGFLNLCDAGIVLIALLYGANYGGLVGALSGFLLDLLAGAPQYMLFSLVIHGFEGWVFGKVIEKEKTPGRLVLAVVLATIIVSCGYLACETFQVFNSDYWVPNEYPPSNCRFAGRNCIIFTTTESNSLISYYCL